MRYALSDLIDLEQFQELQDYLNKIYPFPSAIIDNDGNILTATAWQDICTKFHRQNSECEKECIKSDQYISSHLDEAKPAVTYRCPHGLVDNAIPIVIDGVHLGNFFTGQFFLEEPDLEVFRAQAKQYGFDETAYLEAVKKVPVWTQQQLDSYLAFIKELIEVISSVALKSLHSMQTQEKIETSYLRQKAILQTAMNGYWRVDLEGHILEVNDAYCRMSGYPESELLTMRIQDLEANERPGDTSEHLKRVMTQGGDRFETRHRTKDGRVFDVEVSVKYLPMEGGQVFAFVRDITERKQAEDQLKQERLRLAGILEGTSVGTWEWNVQTGETIFNERWAEIVGYTLEELVPVSIETWTNLVHPDDAKESERLLEKHFSGDLPGYEFESRMKHKDGHWVWVLDRGKVISWTDDGKPLMVMGTHQDITERKRSEQALKDSEQKWRNVLVNVPQLGVALDPSATIIFVNTHFLKLTGWQEQEVIGKNWFDLAIPEDVRESVRQVFSEVMQSQDILGYSCYENEIITRTGSRLNISWCNLVTRDMHGKVVDVTCLGTDLTERYRAEEALRKSREMLNLILDNVPQSVFWKDTHSRYLGCNRVFANAVGLEDPVEIIGKTDFDLPWPSDEAEAYRADDADVVASNRAKSHIIEPLQQADGTRMLIDTTKVPLCDGDGRPFGILGVYDDVTERKRSEERLNKINECLLGLQNDFHTNVMQLTALCGELFNGTCALYNRLDDGLLCSIGQWKTPAGYIAQDSPQGHICTDVIQKASDEAVIIRHLSKTPYAQSDPNVAKYGLETYFGHPISCGDVNVGSLCVVFQRDVEPSDEDKRTLGIIASSLRAQEERKHAADEKAKLESQLIQSQKMESVGRLAGGVAHDFNNMMAVILGQVELALEDMDPSIPLYADLEEIQKAATRSADLTQQLLAFARKQTIAPKVTDLNETVGGMLKMLRRLIGENVELIWKPGEQLWPVKIDPSQLNQVLANLVVNARDAIADIGKITIATATAVLDDAYCAEHAGALPGEYVQLTVSDTGCGMAEETLAHIFEPFYTTKGVGEGTGLGLSTVYGAVKQNNGFVSAYSELGYGSTFRIYLPRHVSKSKGASGGAEISARAPRGSETLLLVEDEPAILKMTKTMLERQGYTVLTARTPWEAIHLAKEYTGYIHLLITDVILPQMNGPDLANALLTHHPHLKRLFMSGYTANAIAHHGVLHEDVHFIEKPFSVSDIAKKVREVLGEG